MNTKKLKQLVLDLAIHGKLVPQDPNDEPASELLARIKAEKAKTAKGKKCKLVEEDIKPFDIPNGWIWCTMDEVAFVTKLAGFEYSDYIVDNLSNKGVPLFKGKNVQDGRIVYEFESYIPECISDELSRSQITRKCLLTPYVGTIGNIGIHDRVGKFHLGSNVGKIEVYNGKSTFLKEEYLWYFLRSSSGYSELTKNKKATAQESISIDAIREVYIPLPPLSEQRRIVAEIERWFGVIDQLESDEADLKKSIEQTKKKVLDLAIRGKLVKQEAGDEPASELLKRIKENVETHGRASKGKKTAIPSVELDEVPFEVPEGWEWCRLLDIAEQVGSKENQILAKEVLGEGLVPVVSQSSILIDGYSDETDRKMTDLPVILFGDHTRVVKYIDFEFVVGADGTKLLKPLINSKYLYYWTICAADSIRNRGYARHFALLKEVPFPLPPLEEQRRIVERVEEVMGVLERIEKMIKS